MDNTYPSDQGVVHDFIAPEILCFVHVSTTAIIFVFASLILWGNSTYVIIHTSKKPLQKVWFKIPKLQPPYDGTSGNRNIRPNTKYKIKLSNDMRIRLYSNWVTAFASLLLGILSVLFWKYGLQKRELTMTWETTVRNLIYSNTVVGISTLFVVICVNTEYIAIRIMTVLIKMSNISMSLDQISNVSQSGNKENTPKGLEVAMKNLRSRLYEHEIKSTFYIMQTEGKTLLDYYTGICKNKTITKTYPTGLYSEIVRMLRPYAKAGTISEPKKWVNILAALQSVQDTMQSKAQLDDDALESKEALKMRLALIIMFTYLTRFAYCNQTIYHIASYLESHTSIDVIKNMSIERITDIEKLKNKNETVVNIKEIQEHTLGLATKSDPNNVTVERGANCTIWIACIFMLESLIERGIYDDEIVRACHRVIINDQKAERLYNTYASFYRTKRKENVNNSIAAAGTFLVDISVIMLMTHSKAQQLGLIDSVMGVVITLNASGLLALVAHMGQMVSALVKLKFLTRYINAVNISLLQVQKNPRVGIIWTMYHLLWSVSIKADTVANSLNVNQIIESDHSSDQHVDKVLLFGAYDKLIESKKIEDGRKVISNKIVDESSIASTSDHQDYQNRVALAAANNTEHFYAT